MISDEAVEAAARAHDAEDAAQRGEPDPWDMEGDDFNEFRADRMSAIRAALEAALPHLLTSQGCGTGHSADAGSLPALADASGVIRRLIFRLEDLLEIARQWEPDYCGDRFARQLFFAREARDAARVYLLRGTYRQPGPIETGWDQERLAALSPDGGEAVHSPDEREGSRDKPKNDLPNPQKGGEG